MPTQADFSQQIRNALAVSDPQMSTALGTPQRKLIEAVATSLRLADSEQTTTYFLGYLDAYSGTDLDTYVEQFGFSRQQAGAASGTVTIRRENAATPLVIQYGSTFYKPSTIDEGSVFFSTTVSMTMPIGVVSCEIPVVCTVAGSQGNVQAHTVIYSDTIQDYTVIDNPYPMTGGFDEETDEALKTRFKNTLFRNMAGTKDQYIGLAMAYAYTSRAKLISETSEYQEILTVGDNFTAKLDCKDFIRLINDGEGEAFKNDFSLWVKRIEDNTYLRQGIDFELLDKSSPSIKFKEAEMTIDVGEMVGPFDSEGKDWTPNINVSNLKLFPYSEDSPILVELLPAVQPGHPIWELVDADTGELHMNKWAMYSGSLAVQEMPYSIDDYKITVSGAKTPADALIWVYTREEGGVDTTCVFMTNLDGTEVVGEAVSNHPEQWKASSTSTIEVDEMTDAGDVTQLSATMSYNDNPLYRVSYNYRAVNKGDFVLASMDYVSMAWRKGANNVDLYVDGDNLLSVEDVCLYQNTNTITQAIHDGKEYARDDGTPPVVGNYFLPLSFQPVRNLEDSIAVGAGITLVEGEDYWLVHEMKRNTDSARPYLNRGSERASDFVELNKDSTNVQKMTNGTPLHVGYVFNGVPAGIQELVSAQTPVCTDVVVHEAFRRYFKVHLTVMYQTYQESDMTERITQAVEDWANAQEFGVTVQFSDIETVVANLGGVDNVRISTSADDSEHYGIEEYELNNETYKIRHTNDFKLAQEDVFIVSEVIIQTKTQQRW